jgi:cupin-like protein
VSADIESVSAAALTREDFDARFVTGDRPVVIRGALTDTPAFARWTDEYLLGRVGQRRIQLTASDTHTFNPNVDSGMGHAVERDETFAEALRLVSTPRGGESFYVMQQSIPDKLPELLDDVPVPRWLPERATLARVNLWFGAADSASPLHFDSRHNFLGMIRGRKRVDLFAPSETPRLYQAEQSRHRHISQVDMLVPDADRFPLFASAASSAGTLEPGDMLFIPSRWWHFVRSLETSLSVNFWWDTADTARARLERRLRRRLQP